MREIKFRAWQPHASLHRQPGMYLVDDMVWHNATDEQPEKGEVFLTRKVGTSRSSEFFEDVQIMQYTGLKDKNGVEIYEGDILAYRDGEYSYDAIVSWDNEVGRYYMVGISPEDNFHFDDVEDTCHSIIGNIYENPDLLEAKQ